MNNYFKRLFYPAFMFLVLISCVKQPETIVVDDNPKSPAADTSSDTSATSTAPASADFKQLNIGELHPIPTLDPLFADNNSSKRTVQILYEGLVRYNSAEEVVPAIAKRWSVSSDSMTYSFILRPDVFYHDSNIFTSGRGRRVISSDFKFAFERMARLTVPDNAARLFMSIVGFESFFNERHNVLNPAYRELTEVSGIRTPNDSTLTFHLVEKDPHFLQKLASPYAVIYPREAIKSSPSDFAPVGTGPFQLSQQRGDSLYVFSTNNDYRLDPFLNRVDVNVYSSEKNLFQDFVGKNIHFIPEVGPQILSNTLTAEGELQPGYRNNFRKFITNGSTTYFLRHHEGADLSRTSILQRFSTIDATQLFKNLPSSIVNFELRGVQERTESAPDSSVIYTTYTEDPYVRWLLRDISEQLPSEKPIRIMRLRTTNRRTSLFTQSTLPFYPGGAIEDPDAILIFQVRQTALYHNELENLSFNQFPWWLDLRTVNLPGIDQL